VVKVQIQKAGSRPAWRGIVYCGLLQAESASQLSGWYGASPTNLVYLPLFTTEQRSVPTQLDNRLSLY
jgi:hypothetical protein